MAKKTFRRIFSFAILIFVILTSVYLFLHSSYFNTDKVYATGLSQLSEEEVIDFSGITIGQNIFEVNKRVIAKMIQVHPMVKEAEVLRHLPRAVEIKVVERKIWAIVPYNNEFLCIDDEGIVIDRKITMDLSNYPLITFSNQPEKVNLGRAFEPEGVHLIKMVWETLDNTSKDYISDFHYNDKEELVIYTALGTEIRFGNEERLEEKTSFFKEIIKLETEFDQNGKEVLEYIDLRFKGQPVVKTKV